MKFKLIRRMRKDSGSWLEIGAEIDVDLIKERELRSKGYIPKIKTEAVPALERTTKTKKTKK